MELTSEYLRQHLAELRQQEGAAWADLHALQGRIFEVEHLLTQLPAATDPDPTPAVPLASILPTGFREMREDEE